MTSDRAQTLVNPTSGWSRLRLFGASSSAAHVRRRVDLITLGCVVLALLLVIPAARETDGVERALLDAVEQLPGFTDPIFAVLYDLLAAFAIVVVAAAAVRRHWRLALTALAAVPVGVALTAAVDAALGLAVRSSTGELGAPVAGVPVQLVVALTATSVIAREMSRPFRLTGRRLMTTAVVSAFLLPVAAPYRVACGVLLAVAAASIVRLAFGSPVSSVSAGDVRDALQDLGVVAEPHPDWANGVLEATAADGTRLAIQAMGRDDRDAQLAATVWRFLWYRRGGRVFARPRQQVEHQALLMLLARTRGAPVTEVVAAGASDTGDALLATAITGTWFGELAPTDVDDALLDGCWAALDRLHHTSVAHGSITGDALLVDGDAVAFGAFELAEPLTRPNQVHADRAQLLVTTAVVAGADRAVAAALRAIGTDDDDVAALVSYLKEAALDTDLRAAVSAADLSLEDLRTATAAAAGIEVPDLQKVWRVTWGSILRLGMLGLVAYLVISQLADVGWSTIADAISSANPWILAAALVFGQVPRVAQASSLQAASPVPVPLGRVTRLQFATSFINLAVPSTAARVAVSIRFFQRSGATPAGAVSAGALDSFAGFCGQITLLGVLVLGGFGTLSFDSANLDSPTGPDVLKIAGALVAAVVVLIVVVVAVPSLRARLVTILGQLREALSVLRSPATVVRLYLSNIVASLLFSATIEIVLLAFGQHVSFADVIIINESVGLFAGLMPVPGGVGITEGALTLGFVAAGVPESIAFSVALCYRLCTFYLPPIWGYAALRSLRNEGAL